MTNNNHNHKTESPCAFAETLVAVLYGEADDAEKREFRRHLTDCHSCSEELAAFGAIKNSVGEWREVAFAPLAALAVELPEIYQTELPVNNQPSFLAVLRGWLFPFGNRWQGAAVYAALALGAALLAVFGYASLSRSSNNFAHTDPAPAANPEPVPSASPVKRLDNELAVVAPQEKNQRPASPPAPPEKQPQRIEIKPERKSLPKPKPTPRRAKPAAVDLPLDELEDDSIRLSDLFDEISSTD